MDTPPILHIGYPKTATIWFRKNFYPVISNIDYIERGIIRPLLMYPDDKQFDISYIQCFLKENYSKRMVICEEDFTDNNLDITRKYAVRLKTVFPGATIVLFVRQQLNMIVSLYSRYLLGRKGTLSINTYVDISSAGTINREPFNFHFLEYLNVLNIYVELFGKENVYVYLYEDFAQEPTEFLKKFILQFNFDVNSDNLNLRKRNVCIKKNLIPATRLFNYISKKKITSTFYLTDIPGWYNFTKKILITKANRYDGFGIVDPRKLPGKKNVDFIENYYKTSNRKLLEAFDLADMERFGYAL